jgi:hypothetical protein
MRFIDCGFCLQDITHYMGLYFAKSRGARVVNEVEIL